MCMPVSFTCLVVSGKLHCFKYAELMQLTNGFNSTPIQNRGNLIGRGGFAKVYLGKLDAIVSRSLTICLPWFKVKNLVGGDRSQMFSSFRMMTPCQTHNSGWSTFQKE